MRKQQENRKLSKKKILILSLTNQNSDPRVIRQIEALKNDHDIYCAGIANDIVPLQRFIPVKVNPNSFARKLCIGGLKMLGMYESAERFVLDNRIEMKAPEIEFDLIIANDMDAVPAAFSKFRSKKVMADLHEYAPLEFEDKLYWKIIHSKYIIYECSKYFPKLDGATAVCSSIAVEYNRNFGKLPVVITNAASYQNLKPKPTGDKIRIIHHGAAISSRRIELMIEAVMLLDDRFIFDLMLVPNEKDYYKKLKKMVEGNEKIRIIDPVDFKDIVPFCNGYDIGFFVLPPVNFNYRYALPNKFFEFVQARLAIVTGPSVEMAGYINKYELGIVTETFDPKEISSRMNELTTDEIMKFKSNSDLHSKELSGERNEEIMKDLINKIITS